MQSKALINNLYHSNQQWQQHHNPNIWLNDQETTSMEQLKPVLRKTSILASVIVEQPTIQAVISFIETYSNTKVGLNLE